jgi:hypothetical protein
MNCKFWQKKPKNRLLEAEATAFDKIDSTLGKAATDEDFLRVLAMLSARWCATNMEGEALGRQKALRRAGQFYHAVNGHIYNATKEHEPDLNILG